FRPVQRTASLRARREAEPKFPGWRRGYAASEGRDGAVVWRYAALLGTDPARHMAGEAGCRRWGGLGLDFYGDRLCRRRQCRYGAGARILHELWNAGRFVWVCGTRLHTYAS